MSASPAGHTPGRTPNGGPTPRRPPPKAIPRTAANPLVQKKKPAPRKPLTSGGQKQHSAPSTNGSVAVRPAPQKPRDLSSVPFGDSTPSLFTQPPPAGAYTDFPIVMSKRAIMEGLRHHVARFVSRKVIDPRQEEQFTRPLYLLRRDVRAPMPGTPEWEEMQAEQRRRVEEGAGDAERHAQRDAAKAEIAPSLQKKKPAKQANKKKNEAMTRGSTAEQKAKSQLKYEEALPWHFEDDEQNQIWMGTYENASSNIWSHLKFEDTPNGPRYVLTPVQKWYKFDPKTRYDPQMMKQMEERKQKMKTESHTPEPSFMAKFIKAEEDEALRQQDERMALSMGGKGLYRGALTNENAAIKREDENELDFEEDWADDEAPPAIEGEETDVKEIEERIKKDQLKSNVFGHRTLREYQEEEDLEKREEKLLKKVGKKTAKALYKREHNAVYEWDKDNPYSDDSDSTDTEAEIEREKERKEAEEKEKAAAAAGTTKPGTGSAAGSRNNTPGHRPSKHPDPLNKAAASLKRPGSPNLSEASGNESSVARKRLKKNKHLGASSNLSNLPSRTNSPAGSVNGGSSRPTALASRSFTAGSGSETEGGGPRRLKLSSPRSPIGSPGPSRAASRAGSPAPPGSAAPVHSIAKRPYPTTAEEIRDLIPKQEPGIPVSKLAKHFDFDQKDKIKQRGLVTLIKSIAVFHNETRTVTLKRQSQ